MYLGKVAPAQLEGNTQMISPGSRLAVGDGVRVSFENSTVCRACFFWFCASFVFLFGQGFVGEFDPGSGRTLAACLTHASRAERPFGVLERRTGE